MPVICIINFFIFFSSQGFYKNGRFEFSFKVCTSVWTAKRRMYQRDVDVDMLNAVKNLLADVSSVSPSSEQREPEQLTLQFWQKLKGSNEFMAPWGS